MTREEFKQKAAVELVKELTLYGDQVQDALKDIEASIPAAELESVSCVEEAICNHVADYVKQQKASKSANEIDPAASTKAIAKPQGLTSEQQAVLESNIEKTRNTRVGMSTKSKITKALFDKPAAADYIPSNLVLQLDSSVAEKLRKYEPTDEPTDGHIDKKDQASVDVYNKLMSLCNDGGTIPPQLATSPSASRGVVVDVPEASAGKEQLKTVIMSKNTLKDFLVGQCLGVIVANPATNLSAKVMMVTPRGNAARNAGSNAQIPRARIFNANEALKKEGNYDFIKKQTNGTKKVSLSVSEAFKVVTFKKDDNGVVTNQMTTKTVRIKVSAMVPDFVTKTEYEQEFPAKTGNTAPTTIDQTNSAEYEKVLRNAVSSTVANLGSEIKSNEFLKGFSDVFKKKAEADASDIA